MILRGSTAICCSGLGLISPWPSALCSSLVLASPYLKWHR